jgi:predicted membrane protein
MPRQRAPLLEQVVVVFVLAGGLIDCRDSVVWLALSGTLGSLVLLVIVFLLALRLDETALAVAFLVFLVSPLGGPVP